VLIGVSLASGQIVWWKNLAEVLVLVVALVWSWKTSPILQQAIKTQLHSFEKRRHVNAI
jgi:hypothetical protein